MEKLKYLGIRINIDESYDIISARILESVPESIEEIVFEF